jgi:hypothetical protein
MDSLDPEMQYYAEEALKAINVCEACNLKLFKQLQTAEPIELPIVIDERSTTSKKA